MLDSAAPHAGQPPGRGLWDCLPVTPMEAQPSLPAAACQLSSPGFYMV